jgi:hypothetical protein
MALIDPFGLDPMCYQNGVEIGEMTSANCERRGGTTKPPPRQPDPNPSQPCNPTIAGCPGNVTPPSTPGCPVGMNCGTSNGGGGATATKTTQQCLDEHDNAAEGKAVKFFSLYNLATNFKGAWKEWFLYPGLKITAATVLKSIGQGVGTTEFLSVTGGTSTTLPGATAAGIKTTEDALGPVAPFAIAGATAVDVAGHAQCAIDPNLPSNGIPIAPK